MRFVAVKDEEQQANGVVFRARDVLVRQRTQCINAPSDTKHTKCQIRFQLIQMMSVGVPCCHAPAIAQSAPWLRRAC